MGKSDISYCDYTFNPFMGCSSASSGCLYCWSEAMNARFGDSWYKLKQKGGSDGQVQAKRRQGNKEIISLKAESIETTSIEDISVLYGMKSANLNIPPENVKVINNNKWTGEVYLNHKALFYSYKDLYHKTPKRIFVCSMADMFHDKITMDSIELVFRILLQYPSNQYLILTKRPHNMLKFFKYCTEADNQFLRDLPELIRQSDFYFGVTVESNFTRNRLNELSELKDLYRFKTWVSFEPIVNNEITMIKHIEYHKLNLPDWVVLGVEAGRKKRYCEVKTVKRLFKEFSSNYVLIYVKQIHSEKLPPYGCNSFRVLQNIEDFPAGLQYQGLPMLKFHSN